MKILSLMGAVLIKKFTKIPLKLGRTLKDSKKEARNFRASFTFVLYRNKQDILAPKCYLL